MDEKENGLVAAIARYKRQIQRGVTATLSLNWAQEKLEAHRKSVIFGKESGKQRREEKAEELEDKKIMAELLTRLVNKDKKEEAKTLYGEWNKQFPKELLE